MTGKLIALGALAIVAFDLVASVASRAIGFQYSYAAVGSYLIYAAFGFMIGRRANVSAAAFGVAIIAGVEATIGWAVSWVIGPGALATGIPSAGRIVVTIIMVEVIGAAIGALAGFVGTRMRKPEGGERAAPA